MKKLLWVMLLAISVLWFGFAANTGSLNTWSKAIIKKVEVKKIIKKDDKKIVKIVEKKVMVKDNTWSMTMMKKDEVKKVIVKTNKKWDAICGSGETSVSAYTYTSQKWQKVNVNSYCRKI